MNDRLNSTLIEICLQYYLPDEYFIMTLSVIAVLSFFVFSLSVTTALLALRTRKSLFRKERTWITALDFIGGIGGVDSIFESYETFLGRNRSQLEELRREHSETRRRFSSKSEEIIREQFRQKRSESNLETTRRRTLKEEEEDAANIYIEILHNPGKYYQNLPQPTRRESDGIVTMLMRRLSVTSLSAEVAPPVSPPTPARSPDSQLSSSRPTSPAPRRKFLKNRSDSLDGGGRTGPGGSPVNRITTTLPRKKHSVIHEVTEL